MNNIWLVETENKEEIFGAFTTKEKAHEFARIYSEQYKINVTVSGSIKINPDLTINYKRRNYND